MQGNPVSCADPFGMSPYNFQFVEAHGVLDVPGIIPGLGDIATLANAGLYAMEGRTGEAVKYLAVAAAIGGGVYAAGKAVTKAAGTAGKIAKAKSTAKNFTNSVKSTAKELAEDNRGCVDFGRKGGSKTGTVWDNINATQEVYPNTNIPRSFEVDVNGQKMWVHGNATEHMYEDVYKGISTGNGTAFTNPNLYTQELMTDFYGSLEQATKSGITYGEKINSGNWEFIFSKARQEGQFPVIKHAMFNGWH